MAVNLLLTERHGTDPHDPMGRGRVGWDTLIPEDDALPCTELMDRAPAGGEWRPQSSGTLIPPAAAQQLEQLWGRHLGYSEPPRPRTSPRQGWQPDPERRKKVEDAAQDRLTRHFREQGWTVKDTRHGNPYDAGATRHGDVLYLEAKGTETSGSAVIVTPRAYDWTPPAAPPEARR